MLLSECVKSYICDNNAYLKERTLIRYQEKIKAYIRTFGDIDIKNITQEFLQNYINNCQKKGDTKKVLQNRLSLLLVSLRPFQNFTRFRYVQVEKDMKGKEVYLESEVEMIEDYIAKHPKLSYAGTMIAINTGMRVSEIAGLKWADIDFDKRVLTVKRNATKENGKEIVSTPKTKNGYRTIYITASLAEYFKKQKQNADWYVCSGRGEVRAVRTIQRANECLLKKLNITNRGMHAYRHAFATRLLEHSTDFKTIAEVMGHSNIAITQKLYNHTTQKRKNDVVAKAFGEKMFLGQNDAVGYYQMQSQINSLQAQVYDMSVMMGKMAQYIQDNAPLKRGHKKEIIQPDEKLPPVTAQKKPNIIQIPDRQSDLRPPKYKVTDGYGNHKLFYTDAELLEDLDISKAELRKHLNGQWTILDDLEICVTELW